MAPAMASVLTPAVLSLAELHAARLDGELFIVDECFSPVDEVETVWLRSAALRLRAGTRMIAELTTAVWLYGIRSSPPVVHTMCVPRSERIKVSPSPRYALREVTHVAGDVVEFAGLRVTAPQRTLFDLAMSAGAEPRTDGVGILSRWPELAEACASRIVGARNLPGKVEALRRIDRWAGRVDSVADASPR